MTETVGKAETVDVGNAQIEVPMGVTTGGGVVAATMTAIAVLLTLRKRLSKDNLELTKDRAETDLIGTLQQTIKTLQEQNAKLDENARNAWRTRAEDAKRIGELSMRVEHLTAANSGLRRDLADIRKVVRQLAPPHMISLFESSQSTVSPLPEEQNE